VAAFSNIAIAAARPARCGFAFFHGRKQKMPNAFFLFHHYYGKHARFGQPLAKNGRKKRHGFQKICGIAAWSVFSFRLLRPLLEKRKRQPIFDCP